MSSLKHPLKTILELTRRQWDRATEREVVKNNFRKVIECRTAALGGQVYASEGKERVFFNTCKSKCCPSCGNRGTLLWQREQWSTLPDIPFVGIVLTMPDVFWPTFQCHPRMQHDLPALGAAVIQQWAWNRHRVELCLVVIQHTFGGHLNYNPHLHMLASAGGLKPTEAAWVRKLDFNRDEIMELWRFAVISYLRKAHRDGLVESSLEPEGFDRMLLKQAMRRWNLHITPEMLKKHFLGYAGRYIRRLPISQRRILKVTSEEIVYRSKDTRKKTFVETHCRPDQFVAMLSQHVQERYKHSMRYFGLLAPRTKNKTSAALFSLLGQRRRPKPPRQPWNISLKMRFGVDPLLDGAAERMKWVGYRNPMPLA